MSDDQQRPPDPQETPQVSGATTPSPERENAPEAPVKKKRKFMPKAVGK
jgi:hypothetical protein